MSNNRKKPARRLLNYYSYNQKFSKLEYLLLGALTVLAVLCMMETSQSPHKNNKTTRLHLRSGRLHSWNSTFSETVPFSKSPESLLRDPAVSATPGSPKQVFTNAYATLSVGDSFVFGTLVLFHSLKVVDAQADFVAMVYNVTEDSLSLLNSYGIRTYFVSSLNMQLYRESKVESMEYRDGILWSKLRVWQLEDYDKVVMLDTDLFVLRNCDELFNYPEFAGSPIVDRREKINFWRSPQMGMVVRNKNQRDIPLLNWSSLNSGVTVLAPSNTTFTNLINEIGILPNRPCCPSQEFLYFFFEERKKFIRLPPVYNARILTDDPKEKKAMLENMKIYHFVGAKPWKKKDNTCLNRLWWKYGHQVIEYFKNRGVTHSSLVVAHQE